VWKISALPHEFACSSQRNFEEWTQNIRYLHNRIALSKATIKAAELSGLAPKNKKTKNIDPTLLEELKVLDPFAPGKTKAEKEAIWARINEIRDMIGGDAIEESDSDEKTESLSSEKSEDEVDDDDVEKKI